MNRPLAPSVQALYVVCDRVLVMRGSRAGWAEALAAQRWKVKKHDAAWKWMVFSCFVQSVEEDE
jgi:hypothetical protein